VAGDHCTQDVVFAARDWTMQGAATAMIRGGFRHLVVVEGHEVVGLLSMRDIVRCWSGSLRTGGDAPVGSTSRAG
jgi:CBS domain-containing protein